MLYTILIFVHVVAVHITIVCILPFVLSILPSGQVGQLVVQQVFVQQPFVVHLLLLVAQHVLFAVHVVQHVCQHYVHS